MLTTIYLYGTTACSKVGAAHLSKPECKPKFSRNRTQATLAVTLTHPQKAGTAYRSRVQALIPSIKQIDDH